MLEANLQPLQLKEKVLIILRLPPSKTGLKQIVSKSPNIRYWFGIVWILSSLLTDGTLSAQTLKFSSASASRGDQITLELSVESPAGSEPLALQWETKVPVKAMSPVDGKGFVASDALRPMGKTLNCAPLAKTAENQAWRCVVAGGQKPIANGVVATLRMRIPTSAPVGEASMRVENATAVSKDTKSVPLAVAEAIVTIRK